MRTLIFTLWCLSIVLGMAQSGLRSPSIVSRLIPFGQGTNLTVDYWQNFNFTAAAGAITTGQLDGSDNYATTGQHTITDTSLKLLSTASTAHHSTANTLNGSADASSMGLDVDFGTNASDEIVLTLPSDTNRLSVGVWFKPTALSVGNVFKFVRFWNSGGNECSTIKFANVGGTNRIQFLLGSADKFVDIPAVDTWYALSLLHRTNAYCWGIVYDASLSLVGVVSNLDTNLRIPNNVRYGQAGSTGSNAVHFAVDNVAIDWSAAKWPLIP